MVGDKRVRDGQKLLTHRQAPQIGLGDVQGAGERINTPHSELTVHNTGLDFHFGSGCRVVQNHSGTDGIILSKYRRGGVFTGKPLQQFPRHVFNVSHGPFLTVIILSSTVFFLCQYLSDGHISGHRKSQCFQRLSLLSLTFLN
jgi:hypothetical protein